MPRRSRIDVPGALQHIIARGVEERKNFRDDPDGNKFLERLAESPPIMDAGLRSRLYKKGH